MPGDEGGLLSAGVPHEANQNIVGIKKSPQGDL
jgi:hypothetical protein